MRAAIVISAVVIAILMYLTRLGDAGLSPIPEIYPEAKVTLETAIEDTSSMQPQQELSPRSEHALQHSGHGSVQLPEELEQYLESQRKDASEIDVITHGDGTATVLTGNQFSTVLMMVIDEDGNRRIVERQITPKGQIVIPNEAENRAD